MNTIKTLILVVLCSLSFQLLAVTIPFRLGDLLSAEISRNKVVIKNLNAADYDINFKHYAYAVVTFKLQKGRSISIHDFKLKLKYRSYRCVAMRSGNRTFDTKNWKLNKTLTGKLYSLLFIIDSETLGNAKKTVPANLVYNLNNSGRVNYELPFKFVNYDNLTPVYKIPAGGMFTKTKISSPEKL
jgi:hypothetical protein